MQDAPTQPGETVQQSGYSNIGNQEIAVYAQDTWKLSSRLTVNYGLRWESQFFPKPVIDPSKTAYGVYLKDVRFPSTGYLPNQTKEFQPRIGFSLDVLGSGKSALRGSWGVFNARQNMLTQVGAITTNGVQQQTIAGVTPVYPGIAPISLPPAGSFPQFAGVTVFDRNYHNPRIYTTNVGYDQQLGGNYVAYADFTLSKGVYLTRFVDPNIGSTVAPIDSTYNADTVIYVGSGPFTATDHVLGSVTNTISNSKSLYRGVTIGLRKSMAHGFLFDGNYVYSVDKDDDSNEPDPFTFRYANFYNRSTRTRIGMNVTNATSTPSPTFPSASAETFACRPTPLSPSPITRQAGEQAPHAASRIRAPASSTASIADAIIFVRTINSSSSTSALPAPFASTTPSGSSSPVSKSSIRSTTLTTSTLSLLLLCSTSTDSCASAWSTLDKHSSRFVWLSKSLSRSERGLQDGGLFSDT